MILKKIIFYFYLTIFFSFFNPVLSKTINCSNYFLEKNFQDPKNLEKINIEIYDARKWYINFARIVTDRRNQIQKKFKKKFLAEIKFIYKDNIECVYQAKVRQNGDFKDHIKFEGKNKYQSLNIELQDGNIFGITKFKLLLPETRLGANEVFASAILRSAEILSPRTYLFPTTLNNNDETLMLFQENPVKEFIENNNRREGPIFEADEEILWNYRALGLSDPEPLVLNRQTNKTFFLKSNSAKINSIYWYFKLQNVFKKYHISKNNSFDLMDLTNGNYEYFKKFLSFEILNNVMGNDHGLIYHNRKFFANNLENSFEPIYYDGMIEIFSNPQKKFQIFKEEKNNFNNLFYYLSKIEDIEKFRSELIDIFSEKNMQSIFNNTNFNTKVSYIEFQKSINYIIENLNYFFDQYKVNINNLPEVNFVNKIENYNKFLSEKYDDLIFYRINFDSVLNENKFVFEECINNTCELKLKDSKFLTNLVLGSNIGRKKNILFTTEDLKLPELYEKSLVFNNNKINFIYSKNLKVNFDEEKQLINIYKNHDKDFILFYKSNFENLTVNFQVKEKNILEKKKIDRANEFNLTGCVNFYKVEFKNVKMNISDADCEDALNILNSKGTISELNINNSQEDGLDSDFSDLTILNLNIKNAFNDCADFSLGNYYIKNAYLNFCGDKGISIGENSFMKIENLKSYNSNLALASKDSSKTKIISGEIENVKYCLSAYKKKQEFNGSLIEIKNLNCKNYFKKFEIDENSKIDTLIENL